MEMEMPDLHRQVRALDQVVEYLEGMNLQNQTVVPERITVLLDALGLTDTSGQTPTCLLPRVLDRQRRLRLQLARNSANMRIE